MRKRLLAGMAGTFVVSGAVVGAVSWSARPHYAAVVLCGCGGRHQPIPNARLLPVIAPLPANPLPMPTLPPLPNALSIH